MCIHPVVCETWARGEAKFGSLFFEDVGGIRMLDVANLALGGSGELVKVIVRAV